MFGLFRRRPPRSETVRVIRAAYDAAISTSDENHWRYVDSLSSRQANSPEIRKKLRDRSRYETANNCYARGMVQNLADSTIGTGPQLQLPRYYRETTRQQRADAEKVEYLFDEWAAEIALGHKLHTARVARAVDGEGCGILRTNSRLDNPVKLDVQLLETEQFTSPPAYLFLDPTNVDGIEQDAAGNVVAYHLLRHHPNEAPTVEADYVRIPESSAFIWYRTDRPGQLRGIPELTPALGLFAQLRRFVGATLDAAEFAARPAGVLSTEAPPAEPIDPVTEYLDVPRNALLTLPNQTKLQQLTAEHPNSTFEQFVTVLQIQIGRALGLPRAIALGDASQYNYASGRLDHQLFDLAVEIDQRTAASYVLRKIYRAWLREAVLIDGYLPRQWRTIDADTIRPTWRWKTRGHVDRQKEAEGTRIDLELGLTTLAEECARRGLDWEDVLDQRRLEIERTPTPNAEPQSNASAPTDRGNL